MRCVLTNIKMITQALVHTMQLSCTFFHFLLKIFLKFCKNSGPRCTVAARRISPRFFSSLFFSITMPFGRVKLPIYQVALRPHVALEESFLKMNKTFFWTRKCHTKKYKLSDKISADKTTEISTRCRKLCLPKFRLIRYTNQEYQLKK